MRMACGRDENFASGWCIERVMSYASAVGAYPEEMIFRNLACRSSTMV